MAAAVGSAHPLAAEGYGRALRFSVGDVALDLVDGLRLYERPDLDSLPQPVAHLHRGHLFRQFSRELVQDSALDKDAVGADAGLTYVSHLVDERPLDGGFDVGVVEDDERGVAAPK